MVQLGNGWRHGQFSWGGFYFCKWKIVGMCGGMAVGVMSFTNLPQIVGTWKAPYKSGKHFCQWQLQDLVAGRS